MVVLNKIYTRTGDDGSTALGSGGRRKKYDLRIAAYGTVDETNAVIGVARLHTAGDAGLDGVLARIQNDLFDVRSFVLPGGSPAAAYLHLARTICRRAERLTAELKDKAGESVTPEVLKYLNRLSDYLFVASRYANGKGSGDVLWKPGENR
jgi:cob(I)alamin adenosyltransferase